LNFVVFIASVVDYLSVGRLEGGELFRAAQTKFDLNKSCLWSLLFVLAGGILFSGRDILTFLGTDKRKKENFL